MKLYIRPWTIVPYIITLAIIMALADYFRTWYMAAIVFVMIVMMVFDLFLVGTARGRISIELSSDTSQTTRGSNAQINIRIKNASLMPSAGLSLFLVSENSLFKDPAMIKLVLPLYMTSTRVYPVPIALSLLGDYHFSLKQIKVRDILGFCDMEVLSDATADITVFPSGSDQASSIEDFSAHAADQESAPVPASGVTDDYDIKEYSPGDRLHDIHWKLSAKQDALMVMKRNSDSDRKVYVLLAGGHTPEVTEKILNDGYQFLTGLVRAEKTPVLVWPAADGTFRSICLSSEDDIKDAYSQVYETSLPASDMSAVFAKTHPEISEYIRFEDIIDDQKSIQKNK